MSTDALYLSAPEYIVKFPEITVPDSHKVEDFSGFVPVQTFTEAGRVDRGIVGALTDGNQPLQDCVPITIWTDEVIRGLLIKLVGKGYLKKKLELIRLARDDDDGHTERYKAELEGIMLRATGPDHVVVLYQHFEASRYRKDESTIKEAFDFVKQKAED